MKPSLGVVLAGLALVLVAVPARSLAERPAAHPALASARPEAALTRAATPIQHAVFIVQENRSFNNFFMGFPGAFTQNYGYNTNHKKVMLHAQQLAQTWDIDHSANAFFEDYDNGKLDGWNKQAVTGKGAPPDFAYAYVPQAQISQYWAMAKQYVLTDEMFQSNLDGSFVAHQYTIAAYGNHSVNFPASWWGCPGGLMAQVQTLNQDRTYGPNIVACWDVPTIADEADAAGVSWRYYAASPMQDGGIWSAYQAISHIYNGSDWTNDVISPAPQFLTDIAAGKLANITWIVPNCANSDHPGCNLKTGPEWVTSLVNAIGESPYWNSTAIFLLWDDWGGWFDPAPPIYKDYDGLGFRIPMIVISPYAKKGYVSHVQYETSSVLRYIEDNFGLGQLAASDARAADPAGDAFDYTAQPRKFHKFKGGKPTAFWINQDQAMRWHRRPPATGDGD